jgi:hypothetical protein
MVTKPLFSLPYFLYLSILSGRPPGSQITPVRTVTVVVAGSAVKECC